VGLTGAEGSIEFRAYRAGDEHELVGLFERVFGRPISREHWRWKFKSLPGQVENVWLATAQGQLAFQYACVPVAFQLPDRELRAMVSMDTMTAPEHQRKGLLTQGAARAYAAYRQSGAAFVIGLPNEAWGSRTTALGWEPLIPLRWLSLPIRLEAVLGRKLRLGWLQSQSRLGRAWAGWRQLRRPIPDPSVSIRTVNHAGSQFDQLWREISASYVSIVRDRAWVQWRYLDCPTFDYRILLAERAGRAVGYLAYRLEQGRAGSRGLIAELTTPPTEQAAAAALLQAMYDRLRAAGADSLHALAVPGSPAAATYRRFGLVPRRRGFDVMIVPLDPTLPLPLMRSGHRWLMAGGDFDVV